MPAKLTQEEFIRRSVAIHGDTYDYSRVNYINKDTKVEIICKIHGPFLQIAHNHVSKKATCIKCAKKKIGDIYRKGREKFVKQAVAIHGDKYNYDKVIYNTTHDKVIINCPIEGHGDFLQVAKDHISGHGCPKCCVVQRSVNLLKTHTEYVNELYIKYNDRVEVLESYKGIKTNINHKYKKCGHTVPVCPSTVLNNLNCGKCAGFCTTSEEYRARVANLHNGEIIAVGDYCGLDNRTEHRCLLHNVVWISAPNRVLRGQKCPVCRESLGEAIVRWHLTKIGILFEQYKTFPDCKYRNLLSFDFYIKDINGNSALIEFQGGQHYFPVSFGRSESKYDTNSFKYIQLRDNIKRRYAEDKGIKLICIPFWQIDIVDEILMKHLGIQENNFNTNLYDPKYNAHKHKSAYNQAIRRLEKKLNSGPINYRTLDASFLRKNDNTIGQYAQ